MLPYSLALSLLQEDNSRGVATNTTKIMTRTHWALGWFESMLTINLSIYNIIRWFAGPMEQTTCRPSVWYSKYYFILAKFFQFILFIFFIKSQKLKYRVLSALSQSEIMKKTTWKDACVDESFVPPNQRYML